MLLAAVAVLIGFIILIWSADLFVAGAASIADNMGMSPILIGLTIVSLGTSAPEILVSIIATLADSAELAIGNAIGSNIANVGLVLGVTIIVAPLHVHESAVKRELATLIFVTIAVGLLIIDGELSRIDGYLMMTALVLIIVQMARTQAKDPELCDEVEEEELPHLRPMRAWLTFAIGLAMLIGSSRLLVWGASEIATGLGVSKMIIGLTIVAIGTSLPELAATVASALRGHTEIALGNVIGSNLFNLLGVMSIPGILAPQMMEPSAVSRDYLTMTLITLFLAIGIVVSRKRARSPVGHSYIGRLMGFMLISLYALYYGLLYVTA